MESCPNPFPFCLCSFYFPSPSDRVPDLYTSNRLSYYPPIPWRPITPACSLHVGTVFIWWHIRLSCPISARLPSTGTCTMPSRKTMKLIMFLAWLKLKQRFLKSGHYNTFSEMSYLPTILSTSSQEAIAKALCLACQVTLGGLFSLFYNSPSPCWLPTTILTSTLYLKTWSLYSWLSLNSLCSTSWPTTHRDPRASAFWTLGLKVCSAKHLPLNTHLSLQSGAFLRWTKLTNL